MTRLIDVDAIDDDTLYAYGFFTDGYDVREMLANQPTVEAVPIEWIRKWQRNSTYPMTGAMLIDWKKEQEKQNETD